jgi:hypothetical protein
MFHSLLANILLLSIFSTLSGMSCPGVTPVTSEYRSESAPNFSTVSTGSITLPFVLDIFEPSAARTSPCMYTVSKGALPVSSSPIIAMRATQKKRMSYPVSRHCAG